MTSISNGESGSSVRIKLNASLAVTDAFTVSSGNVGIGGTPATQLDLAANNTAGTALNVLRFTDTDLSATAPQELGKIEFYSADNSAPGAGVKASITGIAEVGNPGGGIAFSTDLLTGTPIERMRIDRNGNVGIGTSSPASKLELRSSATNAITMSHGSGAGYDTTITSNYSATQSFSLASAGFSVLSFRPADGAAVVGAKLRVDRGASAPELWLNGASGTDQVGLKAGSGGLGAMEFYTAGTERMRIDSSGNVGIGTSSPTTKLDVAGTANATTLSIGGTAITATAAELNYNDITALGTSQASKTVTADANGDVKFSNAVVETVFALTGTTPALNPTSGMIQTWTLSASSTPTDSLNAGESLTLMIDDGTAYTITWPSVTWKTNGGVAPTLNTTGFTVIVLWKVSTVLYGARVGDA